MTLRPLLAAFVASSLFLVGCSNEIGTGPADGAPDGSSARSTTTTGKPTATPDAGPAAFEGSRAYEHIRALSSTIGPRVAGTEGELKAAEYVAAAFRANGYSVEVTEFDFAYELTTGVVGLGREQVDATVLSGSGIASATGRAVLVGTGDAPGVAGKALTGAIAVVERGVPFREVHDRVAAAGAVGIVVLNSDGGAAEGNLGKKVDIPVVMVSDGARDGIRSAAAAGTEVAVSVDQATSIHSRNVLARPAAGGPCSVIVGGHLDTVPGAPGALDNGSGTATTLELARAFAVDGLDAGLCFAAFGGEEEGLYGSAAMANLLKRTTGLPKAMINLDMTGLGEVELIGTADLTQQGENVGQEVGIPATRTTWPSNFGSDHLSFQRAGVPALTVSTSELGRLHTPGDVLATINASDLEDCGDFAYAFITRIWKRVAQA